MQGSALKILIATDAWHPQVNGVVRTLEKTAADLEDWGHRVSFIEPTGFRNVPIPFYPEIRLGLPAKQQIERAVRTASPDCVHIATEGPIGLAVRAYCLRMNWQFTTSYHTKFPEYLERILGVPPTWSYRYMRWFHRPAALVMVATHSLEADLAQHGFTNRLGRWSRGVDLRLFHPRDERVLQAEAPIQLYVGRVSLEKNIQAFLALPTRGTKVVVGDGPLRPTLERKYPDTRFLGYKQGEELAQLYANADVVVFPSKTDTFGLVIVEALASGVPVAAYPAAGPIDILTVEGVGCVHEDLGKAIEQALLKGDPEACVRHAHTFSWEQASGQFLDNLVRVDASPVVSRPPPLSEPVTNARQP